MRVTESLIRRRVRIGLLTLLVLGWGSIAVGIAADLTFLTVSGVAMVAVVNLVIAKTLLEIGSRMRSLAQVRHQADATDGRLRQVLIEVEGLRTRTLALTDEVALVDASLSDTRSDLANQRASIGSVHREVEGLIAQLRQGHEASEIELRAVADDLTQVSTRLSGLDMSHETTRSALTATRALTNKLAGRVRAQVAGRERLAAAATTDVEAPLLSIAIPSFDRPGQLKELLASLASEVLSCPPGLVEVCIADDASPDPEAIETALMFAEEYGFASFRMRETNVGIERNVLGAGETCRGEYLMLVGNDDVLLPDALTTIIKDIEEAKSPVLLYAKRRINGDGSPRDTIPGSTPIDIDEGNTHLFPTFIEASQAQGLLSTFGYVGPIVVRRQPFMAVDPTPYLDLTMYAPMCAMVEAFAREPVFYRNQPTILHRTPKPSEKLAESIGRREEEFMTGGRGRQARYFGTTLAAALQRLVERGALDHQVLAVIPENLMTSLSLVDWIETNRGIDPTMDERLDESVVNDADRFMTAISTCRNG